jgi:AraC-like DNA-binding protein
MTQQPLLLNSDQLTRINAHSLLVLTAGQGVLDIDFTRYPFAAGEVLSLAPGQYVRLVAGELGVIQYTFSAAEIGHYHNTRFLFKHLVGVAHVALQTSENKLIPDAGLLGRLVQSWQAMNPFKASAHEIDLLFSLKDVIDTDFREPISVSALSAVLHEKPARIQTLTKQKIGTTVNQLHQRKLLLEARRQVVFSAATTKEIGYDLGFSDPAYFNRFFKQHTGQTPHQFRDQYPVPDRDQFLPDLLALIDQYANQPRPVGFYAEKLFLTTETLARKTYQKSGMTINQLVQNKRVSYAKTMLQDGFSIVDVAFNLGFSEPNHFSAFFKNLTGQTPTQFTASHQKVQFFAKTA